MKSIALFKIAVAILQLSGLDEPYPFRFIAFRLSFLTMRNGINRFPPFIILYEHSSNDRGNLDLSKSRVFGTVKHISTVAQTFESEHGALFVAAGIKDITGLLRVSNLTNRTSTTSRLRHICTEKFLVLFPAALLYIEEEPADVFAVTHVQDNIFHPSIEDAIPLLMDACRYLTQDIMPRRKSLARSCYTAAGPALRAFRFIFSGEKTATHENTTVSLFRTFSTPAFCFQAAYLQLC